MAVHNYDIGKFERNYNSPSNEVLDSLVGIETKAEEKANRMKVPVDDIYAKLGFDPILAEPVFAVRLDRRDCAGQCLTVLFRRLTQHLTKHTLKQRFIS